VARRLRIALLILVGAMAGAANGTTGALFSDPAPVGSNALTTATLQAPTALGAAAGCNVLSPKITLTWSSTTSTFADGYDVHRGTANGGPYSNIAHVTGRTAVSYVDTSVTLNKTYYYVLRATAFSWTSASSNQANATTPIICL
jgi:fibronectin type 3 domain-containing protein